MTEIGKPVRERQIPAPLAPDKIPESAPVPETTPASPVLPERVPA